jgi:hypothetical protein
VRSVWSPPAGVETADVGKTYLLHPSQRRCRSSDRREDSDVVPERHGERSVVPGPEVSISYIEHEVAHEDRTLPPVDPARAIELRPTDDRGYAALARVLFRDSPVPLEVRATGQRRGSSVATDLPGRPCEPGDGHSSLLHDTSGRPGRLARLPASVKPPIEGSGTAV